MKSQPDLEERFRAAANRLEIGPPPFERIVRRGRRRFVTKAVTSAAMASVVAAALVWTALSLAGFRQELRLGNGTTIRKPRVTAAIPLSGIPWGVTYDGHRIWVASYFDDRILAVDPETNTEVARISVPTGKAPYEIVAGQGHVWAGAYGSTLRIDPSTGRASDTGSHMGVEHVGYTTGMASGDGSIWLSSEQHDTVLRFDPLTNRVLARIRVENPTELAFAGGSLWVGGCHKAGNAPIYRIDPVSNAVAATIRLPAAGCAGLLAVDGAFLYSVTAQNTKHPHGSVWKIDINSGRVLGGPLPVTAPGNLVVYRGVVWVLTREEGDINSFLTMIDATSLKVLARMSVGQNAWRIAAGDGSLWVPAMRNGKPVLLRIAP
jgi:YVTN family beta-propeller protein